MIRKKGRSSGIEVSVLIMLIALFILIYVIMLPPAEREALLNETLDDIDIPDFDVSGKVLLSESPGKVFSYSTNIHTINIEPMHVYSRLETESFTLIKSMTVSRNLLKDNFKVVHFDLNDLSELNKVQLFFLVAESKGPIRIYLNSRLLYDGVLSSSQMPLELPLANLQQKNKLELYSASPGINVLSSNYYLMQDVQLIKTFKVEKTKASRTFHVSEELGQRLSRASLAYFVTCNEISEKPTLTISLNNQQIFKDTVFCEYLEERKLPLGETVLNAYGRNKLEMSIDKGDINIDELKVRVELSKSIYPSYTFDVSSTLWAGIQNDGVRIKLRMKLVESGRKSARLSVQGEQFNMDTSSSVYEKDITDLVDNGANVFKIEPKETFEILNLKVYEE